MFSNSFAESRAGITHCVKHTPGNKTRYVQRRERKREKGLFASHRITVAGASTRWIETRRFELRNSTPPRWLWLRFQAERDATSDATSREPTLCRLVESHFRTMRYARDFVKQRRRNPGRDISALCIVRKCKYTRYTVTSTHILFRLSGRDIFIHRCTANQKNTDTMKKSRVMRSMIFFKNFHSHPARKNS